MKYVVTDDFVAAHGWTPDKVARALKEPLAHIGYSWSEFVAWVMADFNLRGLR